MYMYMYMYSAYSSNVSQTHNYVTDEILRMEPDEGLERLQMAFHVCGKYRENYEDRRAHLADYFKEEPVAEWDFESSLIFTRVDRLINQLRLIEVRHIHTHTHTHTSHSPPSTYLRNISTW